MNRVFKNINIFLPKKSIFPKKNFEKSNIFDRNFWIFSNNYLKSFNFNESYKSREIFGEFYYLVEKFTVAAPGIFSGGNAPATSRLSSARGSGGPVAKAHRTVAKFHFLKRFKVSENEFTFQKCQHFSSQKDPFFKKNLEKVSIFYKNFWIFSNNYVKFSIIMIPYKSREILCEF